MEKGKGIFQNEFPRRRFSDEEGKRDFPERANENGHFAISSEEWAQSRQVTLDTRKTHEKVPNAVKGQKMFMLVFAPAPVVAANLFLAICFCFRLFAREKRERRERSFTPLKVLV